MNTPTAIIIASIWLFSGLVWHSRATSTTASFLSTSIALLATFLALVLS